MKLNALLSTSIRVAASLALILAAGTNTAEAAEPCGDFGECKALIEINSTDGDIGFHFLMDGDDLISARIDDPNGTKVFEDQAKGPLREQKLTETFAESAEPLCWNDPEADTDEEIVTLEEFLERWVAGTYAFSGMGERGEKSNGKTELTHELPAAPRNVTFDGGVIRWDAGDDLGNCASFSRLAGLVSAGVLPVHPIDVTVVAWEIVLEPDVEDGDPTGNLKFSIRVPGDIATKAVTVPADYLASLPADTPVKVEVGALGVHDNATFTETDGFCVNEDEGCE
ncbi:MAG TPA: hypothetical protein VMO47_09380 [Rhodothermales bacterium]|nr:hypothetical protein [Rhodothermales bacterium]